MPNKQLSPYIKRLEDHAITSAAVLKAVQVRAWPTKQESEIIQNLMVYTEQIIDRIETPITKMTQANAAKQKANVRLLRELTKAIDEVIDDLATSGHITIQTIYDMSPEVIHVVTTPAPVAAQQIVQQHIYSQTPPTIDPQTHPDNTPSFHPADPADTGNTPSTSGGNGATTPANPSQTDPQNTPSGGGGNEPPPSGGGGNQPPDWS